MVLEDHVLFWVLKEEEDCTTSANGAGRPLVGMALAAPTLMTAGIWGCHVYPHMEEGQSLQSMPVDRAPAETVRLHLTVAVLLEKAAGTKEHHREETRISPAVALKGK